MTWVSLTRESASATQDLIEETIGLDRGTFRASAYAPQDQAGIFCNAQPRERKQILAAVLGLDVWDGYRDRARVDLRVAEQSLAVVRAKIEQAEDELNAQPAVQSERDGAQRREREARAALKECGLQLAKARERLSKLREAAGIRDQAVRARDAAEASHASLLARIAALESQIQEAETRLAEREGLETLVEGLPGLERERDKLAEQAQGFAERERLEAEHRRLSTEAEVARKNGNDLDIRAARVLLRPDEKCDRCGQTLHAEALERAVESYNREAEEFYLRANTIEESDLPDLNARIAALPATGPDRERAAHVHDLIQLGQNAQQKLAALDEVQAAQERAGEELLKLQLEEPEAKAKADRLADEVTALGPHDPGEIPKAQVDVARGETVEAEQRAVLDSALAEIARLDERLERLDRIAAETKTLTDDRDAWQSEIEMLSHLERACGPNGVPALILETSAIPQLEAEWNRLLQLLPTDSGDLFEVELHTQRERKTGEGAVDALDIVVYKGGIPMPYSNYSGGEKMRISLAQRRALSALLAHRKGAESPLMILDEPNALDAQGTAALVDVLHDLAEKEGLTILLVAHDPALRDAFEQSIELVVEDGRSRIVGQEIPVPA